LSGAGPSSPEYTRFSPAARPLLNPNFTLIGYNRSESRAIKERNEQMGEKPNILVLCTGNSCRSQMAEGLLRHYGGDRFEVHSAGTNPQGEVHPLATQVMAEIGLDISAQRPKGLKGILGRLPVRYLIIVCSGANESCPVAFPGVLHRLFWPFDDPAAFAGSPEETVAEFRRVRDQIRDRVEQWLADDNL
jgi:arsenate reductase